MVVEKTYVCRGNLKEENQMHGEDVLEYFKGVKWVNKDDEQDPSVIKHAFHTSDNTRNEIIYFHGSTKLKIIGEDEQRVQIARQVFEKVFGSRLEEDIKNN